eukprot:CAMPEP_0116575116 /NCGR_PEP_ID=MMETSP0397-20121206/19775_1 /TAXON_ID=216820 /ORGANISM="Cyclophora tenuis, Strain ECT3854" /LENGTH=330 /DNA_ID=CAMNT_0004103965 /DNA_START=204 /DNA_END=1193 /DNA_ORIENTATION=-
MTRQKSHRVLQKPQEPKFCPPRSTKAKILDIRFSSTPSLWRQPSISQNQGHPAASQASSDELPDLKSISSSSTSSSSASASSPSGSSSGSSELFAASSTVKPKSQPLRKPREAPSRRQSKHSEESGLFLEKSNDPVALESEGDVTDDFDVVRRPPRLPVAPGTRTSQLTEIHSVGSAGDIHVGAMLQVGVEVKELVRTEDSEDSDDITLDPELKADEERLEGGRKRDVPAVNDVWRRKDRRKQPFGSRLRNSIRKWTWTTKKSSVPPPLQRAPRIDDQRCLLHAEEDTYDRTHVLDSNLAKRDDGVGVDVAPDETIAVFIFVGEEIEYVL